MYKHIVVLQSFPEPQETTNPYITMLWHSLSAVDELEVKTFTWRAALVGGYDVFHVHWPEILVSGRTPLRSLVRRIFFVSLMLRLIVKRTPVVRTVHNVNLPKDITWLQRHLLTWLESRSTYRITLNSSTVLPKGQAGAMVLHGHYRNWFAEFTKPEAVPNRVGYFGLIRSYKRVDRLIWAFRQTEKVHPELSLHVVGRPSSDDLAEQIKRLAAGDDRIQLSLRFQSDAELAREAAESQLVVFPYEEMHNSGGVLTALSLGRQVLVPDNLVNRELSDEVGPGWVYVYSGELTGDVMLKALEDTKRMPPGAEPNLEAREWGRTGTDHMRIYRGLLDPTEA